MTTPESITVNLDYAKRLKAAGWPQRESLHWWIEFYNSSSTDPNTMLSALITDETWYYGEHTDRAGPYRERSYLKKLKRFAAPTASEILGMLPRRLTVEGDADGKWICINSHADREGWKIGYLEHPYRFLAVESTLANAAAAMYVYLAEHSLLSPHKVN